jgi:hypothetical protein
MRSVLALGLLITLCAPANAATVHRSKQPEDHLRPRGLCCSLQLGLSMQLLVDPTMNLDPIRKTSLATLRLSFEARQ